MINGLLVLAFLFFMGSLSGWCLEVFYRRFFSSVNKERKWINPGFLTGPYLPLYGFSLCILYALAHINISFIHNNVVRQIVLFAIMALAVTLIEFLAGLIFIKRMKIKLWDYDEEWGNVKGIICPKYTFYWAVLSAIYYFLIHPHILNSIFWLSEHLAFSFVMGFFYGIFALDLWYSMNIMSRIKKFAEEYEVVVRYELLKESIRAKNDELKEKTHFIFAFKSEQMTFAEHIKEYIEKEQEKFNTIRKNFEEKINKQDW